MQTFFYCSGLLLLLQSIIYCLYPAFSACNYDIVPKNEITEDWRGGDIISNAKTVSKR